MSNVKQMEIKAVDPAPSFFAQVWQRLSRVDVADYIEVKGGASLKLSYLSWTFAWSQLMQHYPESSFEFGPLESFEDGSVCVWVTVTVRDHDQQCSRKMWLPVMDHKNQAVANPSARQVSDSRMRCLVKCLGLFGLGLDVYAGSDMPIGSMEDPITPQQAETLNGLLKQSGADVGKFLEWIGAETVEATPAKKYKQALHFLERKARNG